MGVEDASKSPITDDQISNSNANPNPRVRDDDDDDLEEGEIVGEEDTASSKPSTAIDHQPHPLENSWTFWFDNPSAKSKQAAWGSSIRPIYTFSTAEEFWR